MAVENVTNNANASSFYSNTLANTAQTNSTSSTTDKSNETESTNTTSTTNSKDSSRINKNSVLDKDAFLKLLLIEMQNQDPTDPMDTDKMLTQTSQLAALEMQQNTNDTMQKMVETMKQLSDSMISSGNMAVVNAIGRMATITDTTFRLENSTQIISVRMYLPKATGDGGATFEVVDSKGNTVRKIQVGKDQLKQGVNIIGWDGRDDDGVFVGSGNYSMKVSYLDADGGTSTSSYGSYLIESVKFVDGVGKLIIGGKEVTFDQIAQIS